MTGVTDYLGRFHTVVLHLPLGIYCLAFMLQYIKPGIRKSDDRLLHLVFMMGSITALLSWILGWMLSLSGDYAPNAIDRHKWTALVFVIFSLLLLTSHLYAKRNNRFQYLYHIVFFCTLFTMSVAGHLGGSITHGEGFLTLEDGRGRQGKRIIAVQSSPSEDSITGLSTKLPEINSADQTALQSLRDRGFLIRPVAKATAFLEVSAVNMDTLSDHSLIALKAIAKNILWITIADLPVSDKGLSVLAEMDNLRRIDIRNTRATDKLMSMLKSLDHLEYINLVGTAVGDKGIEELLSNKRLINIYCWKTGVTDEGIKRFHSLRPDVKINNGRS